MKLEYLQNCLKREHLSFLTRNTVPQIQRMLQKAKGSCSQLLCGAAAETTATHIHQWKSEILCLINSPLTRLLHQY